MRIISFWTQIATVITDVECFKQSCKKHNVKYEENQDKGFKMHGLDVHAVLTDNGTSTGYSARGAYLCKDGGAFRVVMDNDVNYSSFSKRLGTNGGKLVRDYTVGMVTKNVKKTGGMIVKQEELENGSVVMRVANFN